MKTPLRVAIDAVADACRLCRSLQANLERLNHALKDDRSPVTVADFAVQALIQLRLAMEDDRPLIVGEESAKDLHEGKAGSVDTDALREAVVEAVRTWREGITEDEVLSAVEGCDFHPADKTDEGYWTLDPIDGTKGFLRGQQYAIALARIERGQVVLGVMGCPNLSIEHQHDVGLPDPKGYGTIYAATRGGGAWELRGDKPRELPNRITAAPSGRGAIRVCESVEAAHSKQDETQRIIAHINGGAAPASPLRLDSQCKYAVVARGQADAYLRIPTIRADGSSYIEKIWDHAAGSLIATEAGAIVSDADGKPLDFSLGRTLKANRGIVCAAPHVHARIIEARRAVLLENAQ